MRGKRSGVEAGQEVFQQEVSFHQKLREMRELALLVSRRRAFQAEKQKTQRFWNGNMLGALEKC